MVLERRKSNVKMVQTKLWDTLVLFQTVHVMKCLELWSSWWACCL